MIYQALLSQGIIKELIKIQPKFFLTITDISDYLIFSCFKKRPHLNC